MSKKNDKEQIVEEELTEEALKNLSNNKGDAE